MKVLTGKTKLIQNATGFHQNILNSNTVKIRKNTSNSSATGTIQIRWVKIETKPDEMCFSETEMESHKMRRSEYKSKSNKFKFYLLEFFLIIANFIAECFY